MNEQKYAEPINVVRKPIRITVEEWAAKEVLPLRNKFAPKSQTFTCELDARFEFGGEN